MKMPFSSIQGGDTNYKLTLRLTRYESTTCTLSDRRQEPPRELESVDKMFILHGPTYFS